VDATSEARSGAERVVW